MKFFLSSIFSFLMSAQVFAGGGGAAAYQKAYECFQIQNQQKIRSITVFQNTEDFWGPSALKENTCKICMPNEFYSVEKILKEDEKAIYYFVQLDSTFTLELPADNL